MSGRTRSSIPRSLRGRAVRALAFLPIAALGFVGVSATEARAQAGIDPTYTWRQKARPRDSGLAKFTIELRFGGYYPRIDEEFRGGATPYASTFCRSVDTNLVAECPPQFTFGLEVDWLPLRIPYVGALGPGLGWGYTTMKAPTLDASGTASTISTYLNVMPAYASLVLRFDELMRRTRVPIVPVVKAGAAGAYWWTGIDTGSSKYPAGCEPGTAGCSTGEDFSFGWHVAAGGALALDWLEPEVIRRLSSSTGFEHAYLFGEWMMLDLGSLAGDQMRIGTSSWIVGLALGM
jgi:hypothetical protein